MKYILIFIVLISFGVGYSNNSEGYSHLDNYFYSLKTLEYQNSKKHLDNVSDSILKAELIILSNRLYYATENENFSSVPVNSSNTIFTLSINNLNLGYKEFYLNLDKSKAFKYFHKALILARETKYNPLIKRSLLAVLEFYHYELSQFNLDSTKYLDEFNTLKNDETDVILATLYELIFYSSTISTLDVAYFSIAKKLTIYKNTLKPSNLLLPKIYFEEALSYELKNNTPEAEKLYKLALKKSQNYPFYRYLRFSITIKLSNLEFQRKKYEKALSTLETATKFLNKRDTLSGYYYIYHYKSKYLFASKKYEKAYETLYKTIITESQLDFRKNSLETAKLKVKLETSEKEKQLLIEQQQKKKNRDIAFVLGVLLFFSSTLFLLIQKNSKRKRLLAEKNNEIEQQKVITLLKEQELTSIDAMIEGQEKERKRIAEDLHDDLGSVLTTLRLHFENFKINRTKKKFSEDELIDKTDSLIDEAYKKVRGISHAKNSGVIANHGLLSAVENMAEKISASKKIKIDVVITILKTDLKTVWNYLFLEVFKS